MSRKIIIAVGIVVVVALGIGIWLVQRQLSPSPKYTGPIEKAVLGVEVGMLPAAVWVAENKGYFIEEGLDLTIKGFDSGRLSLLAMLNDRSVDISTVAPTPIMFNSFSRQDFLIFATFVYSDDDIKVIARKDKGINTVEDLKGKKIGTPAGTTGQFFLGAFLTYNGLPASEVEVVDISPSQLPTALESNEVDAIVIWEPHGYNAQQLLQDKVTRLPSSEVYRTTFNFVVMRDFALDHPEVLKRFLLAIDRATTFIKNNKEESQELIAKRLKIDREVIAALWDDFVFEISLDQALILTLEDEARWAIKNNLTNESTAPNYLNYIYFDALEAVKPEVVTIIR